MVSAGTAGREAEMADWVVPVNVVESGTATMKSKATGRPPVPQDADIRVSRVSAHAGAESMRFEWR